MSSYSQKTKVNSCNLAITTLLGLAEASQLFIFLIATNGCYVISLTESNLLSLANHS